MTQMIDRFQDSKLANTVIVSVVASGIIVASAAGLGRAVHNIQGALSAGGKTDIALYLLLPDEGITDVSLLRSGSVERHYLAETKDGPKLVKLVLREGRWAVSHVEPLRAE